MKKHTPGPWTWDDEQCWLCTAEPALLNDRVFGMVVLRARTIPIEADKRLIAASPLLLAACEAENRLDRHRSRCLFCIVLARDCCNATTMAVSAKALRQAALAAAKGE